VPEVNPGFRPPYIGFMLTISESWGDIRRWLEKGAGYLLASGGRNPRPQSERKFGMRPRCEGSVGGGRGVSVTR